MTLLRLRDDGDDHVGELTLRRLRAGELPKRDSERLEARAAGDPALRERLCALAAEERAFLAELSQERFAGGVARALRERRRARAQSVRARVLAGGLACAAAAALALFALPRGRAPSGPLALQEPGASSQATGASARRKGAAPALTLHLRIASPGGAQRAASAFERLEAGDRLRLGYTLAAGPALHLHALTIDARGEVTPVYPDAAAAETPPLLAPAPAPVFLADSFELTGGGPTPEARRERLVVIVRATPAPPAELAQRLRAAYAAARGDLAALVLAPDPAAAEVVQSFLFEKPPGD